MHTPISTLPGPWLIRFGLIILLTGLITRLPALPSVSPGCGGTTYYQDDSDGNGLVVMEAEVSTFSLASQVTTHSEDALWMEFTSNDAGNGGYVRVYTTDENDLTLPAQGARLDFDIDFNRTGTHYVHLRYRASSGANNSVHLAFDNTVFYETYQLPTTTAAWAWNEAANTFTVGSTGTHTFTVFHREDGMDLDRIIITTDPNYVPVGFGPDPTEDGSNNTRGYDERVEIHMDHRSGEGYAVIEAETYTYNMTGLLDYECRPWEAIADPNASGGFYMMTAEQGQNAPSGDVWDAPLMDYEIEIEQTDVYYLHVRHRASTNNRSVHVALNYRYLGRWSLNSVTNWSWASVSLGTIEADRATIMLSFIMGEDATPIDKIILTTDPNYTPTNQGLQETAMVPARLVYQQENGPEHLVQLPMETPSRDLPGVGAYNPYKWQTRSDASALGGNYSVVPNTGSNPILSGGNTANAPVQEFDINFVQTGTHYLYVRHQSPNGSDNSYSYLFDGVKQGEVHINTYSPTEWRFYETLPTFNVPSTGVHTLSIAMREDGTPIDHVTISSSPAYNTAVLPVEMLSLAGEAQYDHNLIYWATASEQNTAYHHVERSLTGLNDWEAICSVPAAGNSQEVIDYEFHDRHPADLGYYRIVTEDMDGSTTISSVVAVSREIKESHQLVIYPNPAADHTNVSFELSMDRSVTFRIITLGGRPVAEREYHGHAGSNTVDLPVRDLPGGSYMVTASVPGKNLMVSQLHVVR